MKGIRALILGLSWILSAAGYAETEPSTFPEVVIGGTAERLIQSDIVGQEYKLWISPPRNYASSDKTYPVIYLLDGQWDFTLMISLYGQLNYDGDIPDALLVGITWGGEQPNVDALRLRDFTPTKVAGQDGSGGAGAFLQFFEKELFPFMQREYRVSDERYLMGSSFGGLFTMYAMFENPALFSGYLPTATSVWWDNEAVLGMADSFAAKVKQHPVRMYMAAGEFDGVLPGFKKAQSLFAQRQFEGLSFKTEILDKLGHSGIKANGNVRGLQYLFHRDGIALNEAQLAELVGFYKHPERDVKVEALSQDGQLVVINPDGGKEPFLAQSATQFFQRGSHITLDFDLSKQPVELNVSFYEGQETWTKVE